MSYQEKKQQLANILTIYGRNAVEEALLDNDLSIYRLHLADSNRQADVLDHCIALAKKRAVEIVWHDKRQLSFISKNAKQDQGIALDIRLPGLKSLQALQQELPPYLLLLDNVTNAQNVGMIIRSVGAGFLNGLILPKKGTAELGPLVIKASAGALFKTPIYRCDTTQQALQALKPHYQIAALSLEAQSDFYQQQFSQPTVFVLGNESTGVSQAVKEAQSQSFKIPMNRQVESLNVAVTAALIAFHPDLLSRFNGQ